MAQPFGFYAYGYPSSGNVPTAGFEDPSQNESTQNGRGTVTAQPRSLPGLGYDTGSKKDDFYCHICEEPQYTAKKMHWHKMSIEHYNKSMQVKKDVETKKKEMREKRLQDELVGKTTFGLPEQAPWMTTSHEETEQPPWMSDEPSGQSWREVQGQMKNDGSGQSFGSRQQNPNPGGRGWGGEEKKEHPPWMSNAQSGQSWGGVQGQGQMNNEATGQTVGSKRQNPNPGGRGRGGNPPSMMQAGGMNWQQGENLHTESSWQNPAQNQAFGRGTGRGFGAHNPGSQVPGSFDQPQQDHQSQQWGQGIQQGGKNQPFQKKKKKNKGRNRANWYAGATSVASSTNQPGRPAQVMPGASPLDRIYQSQSGQQEANDAGWGGQRRSVPTSRIVDPFSERESANAALAPGNPTSDLSTSGPVGLMDIEVGVEGLERIRNRLDREKTLQHAKLERLDETARLKAINRENNARLKEAADQRRRDKELAVKRIEMALNGPYDPSVGAGKCSICKEMNHVRSADLWQAHISGKKHRAELLAYISFLGFDAFKEEYGDHYIPTNSTDNILQSLTTGLTINQMDFLRSVQNLSKEEKKQYGKYLLKIADHYKMQCVLCQSTSTNYASFHLHISGKKHAAMVSYKLSLMGPLEYLNHYGHLPGPNPIHLNEEEREMIPESILPGHQFFIPEQHKPFLVESSDSEEEGMVPLHKKQPPASAASTSQLKLPDNIAELLTGLVEGLKQPERKKEPEDKSQIVDMELDSDDDEETTGNIQTVHPPAPSATNIPPLRLQDDPLVRPGPVFDQVRGAISALWPKQSPSTSQPQKMSPPPVPRAPPVGMNKTHQPMSRENPAASRGPMSRENPAASRGPMSRENPAASRGPMSRENPAASRGPMSRENPAASRGPMSRENPAASRGPMSRENPAASRGRDIGERRSHDSRPHVDARRRQHPGPAGESFPENRPNPHPSAQPPVTKILPQAPRRMSELHKESGFRAPRPGPMVPLEQVEEVVAPVEPKPKPPTKLVDRVYASSRFRGNWVPNNVQFEVIQEAKLESLVDCAIKFGSPHRAYFLFGEWDMNERRHHDTYEEIVLQGPPEAVVTRITERIRASVYKLDAVGIVPVFADIVPVIYHDWNFKLSPFSGQPYLDMQTDYNTAVAALNINIREDNKKRGLAHVDLTSMMIVKEGDAYLVKRELLVNGVHPIPNLLNVIWKKQITESIAENRKRAEPEEPPRPPVEEKPSSLPPWEEQKAKNAKPVYEEDILGGEWSGPTGDRGHHTRNIPAKNMSQVSRVPNHPNEIQRQPERKKPPVMEQPRLPRERTPEKPRVDHPRRSVEDPFQSRRQRSPYPDRRSRSRSRSRSPRRPSDSDAENLLQEISGPLQEVLSQIPGLPDATSLLQATAVLQALDQDILTVLTEPSFQRMLEQLQNAFQVLENPHLNQDHARRELEEVLSSDHFRDPSMRKVLAMLGFEESLKKFAPRYGEPSGRSGRERSRSNERAHPYGSANRKSSENQAHIPSLLDMASHAGGQWGPGDGRRADADRRGDGTRGQYSRQDSSYDKDRSSSRSRMDNRDERSWPSSSRSGARPASPNRARQNETSNRQGIFGNAAQKRPGGRNSGPYNKQSRR